MIVQIFSLRSQKTIARKLESLLRKQIYPDIEVELREISDDYNTHSDYLRVPTSRALGSLGRPKLHSQS